MSFGEYPSTKVGRPYRSAQFAVDEQHADREGLEFTRDRVEIPLSYAAIISGRILIGRGPGLILSSAGLSVRRGLGDIAYLPWSEATTVELKSAMVQLLVIGMRDPEKSVSHVRGYRGWVMRRNLRRFGTPFTIAISLLKWDTLRLLQTVATYRCRYGTS